MTSKKKFVKLTVPEADTRVMKWLEAQDSVSVSVRALIHRDVAVNGYRDAFSTGASSVHENSASGQNDLYAGREASENIPDNARELQESSVNQPQEVSEKPQEDEFHTEDGDLDMDKILGRD